MPLNSFPEFLEQFKQAQHVAYPKGVNAFGLEPFALALTYANSENYLNGFHSSNRTKQLGLMKNIFGLGSIAIAGAPIVTALMLGTSLVIAPIGISVGAFFFYLHSRARIQLKAEKDAAKSLDKMRNVLVGYTNALQHAIATFEKEPTQENFKALNVGLDILAEMLEKSGVRKDGFTKERGFDLEILFGNSRLSETFDHSLINALNETLSRGSKLRSASDSERLPPSCDPNLASTDTAVSRPITLDAIKHFPAQAVERGFVL